MHYFHQVTNHRAKRDPFKKQSEWSRKDDQHPFGYCWDYLDGKDCSCDKTCPNACHKLLPYLSGYPQDKIEYLRIGFTEGFTVGFEGTQCTYEAKIDRKGHKCGNEKSPTGSARGKGGWITVIYFVFSFTMALIRIYHHYLAME